jgi:uncharacterized C2H2 Zn-finger protein
MSAVSSHRSIESGLYSNSECPGLVSRAASLTGSFPRGSLRDSITGPSAALTPEAAQSREGNAGHASVSKHLVSFMEAGAEHSPQTIDSPRSSNHGPKKYGCPFCDTPDGFARKADCKRHIFRDHCTNAVWKCSFESCQVLFDSRKGYIKHAKDNHLVLKPQPDKHRIQLAVQQVYACGFETCKHKVFEAVDDDATIDMGKSYGDHVASHFDDGAFLSDWKYSVQIRNLLHQTRLKEGWKKILPKDRRNQLVWDPQSSSHLKHILEWRLFEDVDTILVNAISLGSPRYPPPNRLLSCVPTTAAKSLAMKDGLQTTLSGHQAGVEVKRAEQLPPKSTQANEDAGFAGVYRGIPTGTRQQAQRDAAFCEMECFDSWPLPQQSSSFHSRSQSMPADHGFVAFPYSEHRPAESFTHTAVYPTTVNGNGPSDNTMSTFFGSPTAVNATRMLRPHPSGRQLLQSHKAEQARPVSVVMEDAPTHLPVSCSAAPSLSVPSLSLSAGNWVGMANLDEPLTSR